MAKKEGKEMENKREKIGIAILLIAMSIAAIVGIFSPVMAAGNENLTTLAVSASPSTVYVGIPKVVNFAVTDANATAVKGASVQLSGVAQGSANTDSSGFATMTINASGVGTINVVASKSGYNDGKTTISAEQAPAPQLNLTSNVQSVYVGIQKSATFTVNRPCGTQAGDKCNGPSLVPVQNVNINLAGAATGSGVTGWNGEVVIPINATKQGTITATASLTGYIDDSITITADYLPVVNFTVERNLYYYGEEINFTLKNDGNVTVNLGSWSIKDTTGRIAHMPMMIGGNLVPGQSINLVWNQKNDNNEQVINGTYKAGASYSYNNNNYTAYSPTFEISNCVNIVTDPKTYTSYVGDGVTFAVNLSSTNQTWDFKWFINGTEVYNQTNVEKSAYTNKSGALGTWNVTAVAKSQCTTISWTWMWTVIPKPQQATTPSSSGGGSSGSSSGNSGSSSGGGGGGGGGVISGENYLNIIKFERQDADLKGNKPVPYTFVYPGFAIYQVLITGRENEGGVGMRIEHLKSASALVSRMPPGKVYANENVWLGSKRIIGVLIKFRINNSWLTDNSLDKENIKLLRFDNEWTKLNTKFTGSDAQYSYFEAKSPGLSSFAVSWLKEEIPATESLISETAAPVEETVNETTPAPVQSAPGFELATVLGAMSAIYLAIRKRK